MGENIYLMNFIVYGIFTKLYKIDDKDFWYTI